MCIPSETIQQAVDETCHDEYVEFLYKAARKNFANCREVTAEVCNEIIDELNAKGMPEAAKIVETFITE